ncbi:hypothetical protein GE300_19795 [Rhodobacteraceae bacterium 2CG4]|uniref:Uncharacterized protein n=1 Tax=Halovulum marinum TaxID=2662447 RepID=A0A6L5Z5H7_9RHOB|nr:hypothetical protein [Halovulum marinum]MSU91821.1 hypothetical protein [Halovulum marinum]
MTKAFALAAGLLAVTALPTLAHEKEALAQIPPGAPYVRVSETLPLPDYLPGLGTLFVDPATLPAGPFLGYDLDGNLSATIYMTPLEELQNGTSYDNLHVGNHNVSSVDIYYNAGHPGVEAPHAHVVLFHDAEARERLAE